jgi:cation diffusion facilitator family transporter
VTTTHGTKATIAALAANFGIATAKFVAFVFTGSASMLAEAIHSVADTSNQALLLLGVRRSRREATAIHPFGYGRERYFWSFMVSVVLFTVGAVFSIVEGYEKLRHPHEVESFVWALGVLGVAVVLEAFSMRTAVTEANHVRTTGWWRFIREAKQPELPVLLLEDLGALVGLIFALTGVALAAITGEPRFDAVGSIVIGLLLGAIAIILAVELRSLLIGESASPKDSEAIRTAMNGTNGLEEVFHIRTLHTGPDDLLVAAKVRMRSTLSYDDVVAAINQMERKIRDAVPMAKQIYIEPDIAGRKLWDDN